MRFNLKGDDYVRGGFIEVNLNPVEDVYDVSYKAFFNLWKKVVVNLGFKKVTQWIPLPNYETSGSVRVPKELLSEAHLASDIPFEYRGARFSPMGGGKFSFSKGQVSGEVQFSFDGNDPAEIAWFRATYDGKTVEGRP